MDEKYAEGNYKKKSGEYSKLKKHADSGYE
jgi:hypothetical protein